MASCSITLLEQREEFVDACDIVVGDLGENLCEPGLRIDVVELGGLDQSEDARRHMLLENCVGDFVTSVGSGPQPLSPKCWASGKRRAFLLRTLWLNAKVSPIASS